VQLFLVVLKDPQGDWIRTKDHVDKVVWAIDQGYLFVSYVDCQEDEYWHASKGKNTSHLFALTELQKQNVRHENICLVNLDADNIISDKFISQIDEWWQWHHRIRESSGSAAGGFAPVFMRWQGEVPGLVGRMAYSAIHWLEMRGYDESFLPMGYQDLDLMNRFKALQKKVCGGTTSIRVFKNSEEFAVVNDADEKADRGAAKVRNVGPKYQGMTWQKMNDANMKKECGEIVRNLENTQPWLFAGRLSLSLSDCYGRGCHQAATAVASSSATARQGNGKTSAAASTSGEAGAEVQQNSRDIPLSVHWQSGPWRRQCPESKTSSAEAEGSHSRAS
jgi:hypothetical protein